MEELADVFDKPIINNREIVKLICVQMKFGHVSQLYNEKLFLVYFISQNNITDRFYSKTMKELRIFDDTQQYVVNSFDSFKFSKIFSNFGFLVGFDLSNVVFISVDYFFNEVSYEHPIGVVP